MFICVIVFQQFVFGCISNMTENQIEQVLRLEDKNDFKPPVFPRININSSSNIYKFDKEKLSLYN